MEILRVEHLTKKYGKGENEVIAVNDVSFSIQKGEFIAIVGSSGSGKSTLLHLLGGVDRPTSGKVFIEGKDIYELLEQSLKEANLEDDMRNRLDIRYIGMVLTAIKNEAYIKKGGDFKDTIAHIKEIFADETLKNVLERVKPIQVDKVSEKNGSRTKERLSSTGKVKATKKVKQNDKLTKEKLRKSKKLTKERTKKSQRDT